MSIFGWLRSLFHRPTPRDVSRLDGAGNTAEEVVDVSGGPLKEGHRRRALRDPRLLPKRQLLPFSLRLRTKKYLPADEARRLFSGTLRTRNRQLPDLLPDPEHLPPTRLPPCPTQPT